MVIAKILNNNVAVVNENNEEKIVMGRGICFKKKVNDEIEDSQIDKIFSLSSEDASHKFQEIVKDIPMEHIMVSEQIIQYAKMTLGKRLNEYIYVSLVDHIYASIVRHLEGINVKNVLLWDVKRFYQDEYRIGKYALDLIDEKLGIRLSDDEAGFIALHIVNAEMDENMETIYEVTDVMQKIMNIVKYYFHVEFDEESVYYYRFVTHLKFFAHRLITKTNYHEEQDDDLLEIIKIKYKNAFACCQTVKDFLYKNYNYELSQEEMLYLTIHISRIVYKNER